MKCNQLHAIVPLPRLACPCRILPKPRAAVMADSRRHSRSVRQYRPISPQLERIFQKGPCGARIGGKLKDCHNFVAYTNSFAPAELNVRIGKGGFTWAVLLGRAGCFSWVVCVLCCSLSVPGRRRCQPTIKKC